ncbi:MAG TPA: 1-acyl-sn-glycerol-3-phosphate acyltransferase [Salinivirgaceae bacterium]|nr:1-acyl-sn-glycerol-3-phosphate acyltransferase [Salinivirgaceae bacterium]
MGKHTIEKFSFGYSALKFWGKIYHDSLYSEVIVINRPSKIKSPHIFAMNHQNALMDAMAVLFAAQGSIVFLARSDIFKNPIVAQCLYFLKILPVYRMRDGFENLKNNDEIFQHTARVLRSRRSLGIYPEGTHAEKKYLRPLQKGVARIVFQTMETMDKVEPFYIIPTGLDYEHYQKFGTRLVVSFGEPIDVSSYYSIYREDQAKALNIVREKLMDALKQQMIDITSERWYDTIVEAVGWSWGYGRIENMSPEQTYRTAVNLAKALSQKSDDDPCMKQLEIDCSRASALLEKLSIRYYEIEEKQHLFSNLIKTNLSLIGLLLGLPGIILYGWFFLAIKRWANRNIKDTQFRTSFRYGITSIAFLILALLLNVWIIGKFGWLWYWLGVVGSGVSGIIGLRAINRFRKYYNRLRTSWGDYTHNSEIQELLKLRSSIFNYIHTNL